MKAELNPLASRVSTALTTAHPQFAASREILAEGDVEFHVDAPPNSNAGALVVSTARGEDIWIRFAPPQMFYGVDDEQELLTIVDALLDDRALFVHIVSATGEWASTTLVSQGQEVTLEAGQSATVRSWSGRFDQRWRAESPTPSWIEFHDSQLRSVSIGDAGIELNLEAYVHVWEDVEGSRRGTGWIQAVRVTVAGAHASTISDVLPVDISSGRLRVGTTTYSNLVPIPFNATEPIHMRLDLASGDAFEFGGTKLEIEATGSARYVEDLPAEFWPG